MNKSIESVILELGAMKLTQLRERYEALYGDPCFPKQAVHRFWNLRNYNSI